MEHFINFDCTNLSEAGGETIFGGEVTTRGDTMRGMCWNTKKDGLMAAKRVKKAIEKGFLVTEFDETKQEYLIDKLFDMGNKRHTKGYYYALSLELFGIIQTFDIMTNEETIDRVKVARLKLLTKAIDYLKQE
jgi:hypothetical protein